MRERASVPLKLTAARGRPTWAPRSDHAIGVRSEGQSAVRPGARLAAAQDAQQLSRSLSVGRERELGRGGLE